MNRKGIAALVTVVGLAAAGLALKSAVDARRPHGTNVEQLQQLIRTGQQAAERGDAGALYRLISEHYEDHLGMRDTQLRYQIGRYLRERRGLRVNIPQESVQVEVAPDGATARVSFQVSASSQGEAGALFQQTTITLTAAREPVTYYVFFPGEEWKITSADGYAALDQ